MLDRQTHRAAGEGSYASLPEYITAHDATPRPELAGPFPNLRCREVVKDLVERVVEVTNFCKFTDREAYTYTLGLVHGARTVAAQDDNTTLERFIVEFLVKLNQGGVAAVLELVEAVTGHELSIPVAEAA